MANWADSGENFDDFEPSSSADVERVYRQLVEDLPPAKCVELGQLLLDTRTVPDLR